MILDEQAIHSLIPNTEWHYKNGVLTVFTDGVTTPSADEIVAEKRRLEKVQAQEETNKANAKVAAEAKLQALGLTTDDLKALGLG